MWKFKMRISNVKTRKFKMRKLKINTIKQRWNDMNSRTNKGKRTEFAEGLSDYEADNSPILFMNETNFNLHITRNQSWSLRGERCSTTSAASEGANIHLIGWIGTKGLIHREIHRGSDNKEAVGNWMKECLRKAYKMYQESSCCHLQCSMPLKLWESFTQSTIWAQSFSLNGTDRKPLVCYKGF